MNSNRILGPYRNRPDRSAFAPPTAKLSRPLLCNERYAFSLSWWASDGECLIEGLIISYKHIYRIGLVKSIDAAKEVCDSFLRNINYQLIDDEDQWQNLKLIV